MPTWIRCLSAILLLISQAFSYVVPPTNTLFQSLDLTVKQNASFSNVQAPEPTTFQVSGVNVTMYAFETGIDGWDASCVFQEQTDWLDYLVSKGFENMGSTVKVSESSLVYLTLIPTMALHCGSWRAVLDGLWDRCHQDAEFWGFSFSIQEPVSGTEVGSGRLREIPEVSVANNSLTLKNETGQNILPNISNSLLNTSFFLGLDPIAKGDSSLNNLQTPRPFSKLLFGMNITLYSFDQMSPSSGASEDFELALDDAALKYAQDIPSMGSTALSWLDQSVSFVLIPTEELSPRNWRVALLVLMDEWVERLDMHWGFSFSIADRGSGREIGSGRLKDTSQVSVARRGLSLP